MKKLLLSLFVLMGSGAYVWAERGWLTAREEAEAKLAEADLDSEAVPSSEPVTSSSAEPAQMSSSAVPAPVASSAEPAQASIAASNVEAATTATTGTARTVNRPLAPDDTIAVLDQHVAALSVSATSAGPLKDGEYMGPQVDAYYGYVEVFIAVEKGRINTVRAQHTPRSSSTSRYINGNAVPKLKKQVLKTQSANVDVITGATLTSKAYAISLAGALDKARL